MNTQLFRTLDAVEEQAFRQWARENFRRGDEVDPLWHPVVRDECFTMLDEWRLELEAEWDRETENLCGG